ncbi:hypothetical protein QR680_006424 [Steinernema hermaphroditum]|uniref:RING-type domain-containing protein n=1 Tax=Steinernema hermaphroditum TaxID=289476 RepID=A0AA39HWY2_9BILA|nr:hypothetical protein QR680_006424 [Steinernema hermaphroditum]
MVVRFCGICGETKQQGDVQMLSCLHTCCTSCLSMSHPDWCPNAGCMGDRKTEFVVDEAEGEEAADESAAINEKIDFGPKASAIQLEERERCEVIKGYFQCVNVARMYLVNCRHRVCFDCLGQRVALAVQAKEHPYCPFSRCANRLTKNDLRLLAGRSSALNQLCNTLMPKLVEEEDSLFFIGKEDYVVYCSVYGNECLTRSITYPKNCTISDMVSSMLQVLQVPKSRTAYNIGVYIKTFTDTSKNGRLDRLDVKSLQKKQIKDTVVHDKTFVVLDVDNAMKQTPTSVKK